MKHEIPTVEEIEKATTALRASGPRLDAISAELATLKARLAQHSSMPDFAAVPVTLPHRALRQIAGDTKEFCYHAEFAKSVLARSGETAKAQSQEAAEACYTLLEQVGILPPEIRGDYLQQARLVAGMGKAIERILNPPTD